MPEANAYSRRLKRGPKYSPPAKADRSRLKLRHPERRRGETLPFSEEIGPSAAEGPSRFCRGWPQRIKAATGKGSPPASSKDRFGTLHYPDVSRPGPSTQARRDVWIKPTFLLAFAQDDGTLEATFSQRSQLVARVRGANRRSPKTSRTNRWQLKTQSSPRPAPTAQNNSPAPPRPCNRQTPSPSR